MSNSREHDEAIEQLTPGAIASLDRRPEKMLVEPMPPQHWPHGFAWCSPDLLLWCGGGHWLHTWDVKVTRGDMTAFIDKLYVRKPVFGVGLTRSVAMPRKLYDEMGGRVAVPDKMGLDIIEPGGGLHNVIHPEFFTERNYRQENELAYRAVKLDAPAPAKRGAKARRGLADEAKKILADAGYPMKAADLAKELQKPWREVAKALEGDGGVEFDRFVTPRVYWLREAAGVTP